MRNYFFPNPETQICASIGFPNKRTKTPFMHNSALEKLGLNIIYHGWEIENVKDAIYTMRNFNFLGYSVGMPHKVEIIKYLDALDDSARKIGACNTVLNKNGKLIGYNSDWVGALDPLKKRIELKGKKVVILGAGGTARAITYGLKNENAEVVILNRTVEKAKNLANEFGARFGDINDSGNYTNYDVLINATPVGSNKTENCNCRLCKFLGVSEEKTENLDEFQIFSEEKIALDVVFQRNETEFTKKAKERNFNVIHGHEMLVDQAIFQFKLFTGHDPDKDLMYSVLRSFLEDW